MNAYQTFTQPWRSAFAVWTVMAQAQTDFALRAMGMTMPRMAARRSGPVPSEAPTPGPVALQGATVETRPEPAVAEAALAEVVPLRLVTEASAPAIATAMAPETPSEAGPEAAPVVAAEEPEGESPVVPVEPQGGDLVQAAIRPLLAAAEEPPVALPEVAPASPAPSRRAATGTRRGGKAKRTS